MITKFIKNIFQAKPSQKKLIHGHHVAPRVISRKTHRINPELISKHAIKVTQVLQEAGFDAYIVGGAVRDLLCNIAPKDFDVATNATPEEVQRLFRRSRIIGRRFQIVHVTFYGKDRPEIIEVSTFRSHAQPDESHVAASGRILRDNVWGTHAEDATRRDFTINAMYYDPQSETVLDYHGGLNDIHANTIRMIGEPTQRYREDPVRMLRAIRFSAKTGFAIEDQTRAPFHKLGHLLKEVPSARIFDELLKLLMSGYAWKSLVGLQQAGLHADILPLIDEILADEDCAHFVQTALDNTDARIHQGKSISPGFLFASLLWHDVKSRWSAHESSGMPSIAALHAAIDDVFSQQKAFLGMQRRHESDMREIWAMQPRLEKRVGRYPHRMIENPKFRAAYDFLLLRCQTGDAPEELGQWWSSFIVADEVARQDLLAQVKTEGTSTTKRRRRSRSRKPKNQKTEQEN